MFFSGRYWHDTLVRRNDRVGSRYWKYVYKQFTDDTFTTEIPTPKSFGIVGPLLRGEVGDVIRVHFRNNASVPLSVHPHGVQYTKLNEGVYITGHACVF